MRGQALRGLGRGACIALLSMDIACSADASGTTPAPIAMTPIVHAADTGGWKTTAELISDDAIRQKVDALVAASMKEGIRLDSNAAHGYSSGLVPTVDGKVTGIGGTESAEWHAFVDLRDSIGAVDTIALLRHESPAVRVYFAGRVADTIPDASKLLYPLLLDTAEVTIVDGCVGRPESVGEAAAELMAQTEKDGRLTKEATRALRQAEADNRLAASVRGMALENLVRDDSASAHDLAISAAQSKSGDLRREGLKALALIADPADIPLIGEQTKSTDAEDREEAAHAFESFDSPEATKLLLPLLHDPNDHTKERAARAYAMQSSASDDELSALLSGEGYGAPTWAAIGLARRGTLHALELLKPMLMSEVSKLDFMTTEMLITKIGAPAIPVARDLLSSKDARIRDVAVKTLGELGDKRSIPAIRKLMLAGDTPYIAADALGDLGAKEAASDLASMLKDSNPNTRIAAAKALVKIEAKQMLPALEKAAETDDTFAKPQIVKAVDALKALGK